MLRSPDLVMRLARLGSFHQSRLSFMRSLLRRLKRERWNIAQQLWDVDSQGVGTAVYTAGVNGHNYSLVAFSHNISDAMRSDRVIATEWDCTFCLFDGIPQQQDIERLSHNVPRQEAGRLTSSELSLSRANRSTRVWDYVVACLAQGKQPDVQRVLEVGYLMRTTAVYGSGKFGALDNQFLLDRPFARSPFALEMLSVYMTRAFIIDLVEHIAIARGGRKAVRLDRKIQRCIGIGNSTGLGMTPFLINHPVLLHQWINTREKALALVRAVQHATLDKVDTFREMIARSQLNTQLWHSDHLFQQSKLQQLSQDLHMLNSHVRRFDWNCQKPWDQLIHWSANALSLEGQEQLVSLVFEPYAELVDPLCDHMHVDERRHHVIDADMTIGALQQCIGRDYSWVWEYDFTQDEQKTHFWYVSEEKLEPRLGDRFSQPGAEKELPFYIAMHVQSLDQQLRLLPQDTLLCQFLRYFPEFRFLVRRIQQTASHSYAELRANLLAHSMLPLDMLRCKLSFFGATRFDPRSDRWIRICMYQYAPLPDELRDSEDDWVYPKLATGQYA